MSTLITQAFVLHAPFDADEIAELLLQIDASLATRIAEVLAAHNVSSEELSDVLDIYNATATVTAGR